MEQSEQTKQIKTMQTAIQKVMGENGSQTPKWVENAVLSGIHDAIPAGSYLASLLKADLVKWFDFQSTQDLDCDVMNWKYSEGHRRGEEVSKQVAESNLKSAELEIVSLQKLLTEANTKVKDLERQMAGQAATIERVVKELNQTAEALELEREVVRAVQGLAGRWWFEGQEGRANELRTVMNAARDEAERGGQRAAA